MEIEKLTVEDVTIFIGGSQPDKSFFSKELNEGYIRLVQIRDYKTNNFLTYIPIDSTSKFCKKSDVMIGRYGPPIFQILRGIEGAYNVALIKASPKENIINDYLFYFLKQELLFKYIDSLSPRTGGQTGVDLFSLKQYPIYLPEKSYQNQVINVLLSLDKKIEINNKINKELESMAKAIYEYWFVQFDFPTDDGKPYKSSGRKLIYNKKLKREIPENWDDGVLNDLGDIIGGSTPSRKDMSNFSSNGIKWITPKDLSLNSGNKFIVKGEIDVTSKGFTSASLRILPKGSVLLSSRAPIGYVAIASNELTTNQGFKSFIPYSEYSSSFIYYTLNILMKVIIQNGSGSTFKEISAGTLKDISVCLPNYEIIEKFDLKIMPILNRQELLEKENKKLVGLRDWLLPMLMNGQVKVR